MTNSTMNRIRSSIHLDSRNGWLAGVCAGIANYFNTDPTIVRIATIVTALFLPKLIIAAYLIAWVLLDDVQRKG
jgi:phage shock protein C